MTNLRIILRPGIQAQPITGTPAVPTLFVQFRDGLAEVSDEELITKMKAHKGFNRQFVSVEDGDTPDFEPQVGNKTVHITSEVKNGQVIRGGNPLGPTELAKANAKEVTKQAKAMAMAMVPELLEALKAEAAKTATDETVESEPADKTTAEPKKPKPKAKAKDKK